MLADALTPFQFFCPRMNRSSLVVATLFVFLLTGCQATHVAYHSTADVPYSTSSTFTSMELVGEEAEGFERKYRVITATDDQDVQYALLAPSEGAPIGYQLKDTDFNRSVPLKKEKLQILIEGTKQTLQAWDRALEERKGTFYEFVHAPEQDVHRVSENVVEWHPAIRFTASHTSEGPTARMILGDSPEDQLQRLIEFESREEVADLRNLLTTARDRLQS